MDTLNGAVIQFLDKMGWPERPVVAADGDKEFECRVKISEDFVCGLFIVTNEKTKLTLVQLNCTDVKIPTAKFNEVIKFCNLVNTTSMLGRLALVENAQMVTCRWVLDSENTNIEMNHILNLYRGVMTVMIKRLPQLMTILYGGKSAVEAIA